MWIGAALSRAIARAIADPSHGRRRLSDHVFAIMYLLGIRFQPRMSSPNDRRLYAFEAKGRYGVLAPEFAERIAREATTEAEQQAARDARYAARKARKRKGR
jgi:TnpA family transposase